MHECLKPTVAGVSLQNFPVGTAAFLGTTKVLFSVPLNLCFHTLKVVTFCYYISEYQILFI